MDDEVRRLIKAGNAAYRREDFVSARRDFANVEARQSGQEVFVQLGWMYQHGKGGTQNVQEAHRCFASALEGSYWHIAATYLGMLLIAEGRGEEAVPILRKAADAGHPPAAMRLHGYLKRTPGSPFHSQSEHYLIRAAALGHEFAKRDLALLELERSHGIAKRAMAWLSLWKTRCSGALFIMRCGGDDPRVH